MATGAIIDDPDLQGAIELFAQIWAGAADYTNMTPRQRAWRMCQTLATVHQIRRDFVPSNFYKHYAVQLGIPGAGGWPENLQDAPLNVYASQAELTQDQRTELETWCKKVRSDEAATEAAVLALNTYPTAAPIETLWLAAHGARPWEVFYAFFRRVANVPTQWFATPPAPAPAEDVWNQLIEAFGGVDNVRDALQDSYHPAMDPVTAYLPGFDVREPILSAYGFAAFSGNREAMRLFQRSFAQSITSYMRRRVGANLASGQVEQAWELINQQMATTLALNPNALAEQATTIMRNVNQLYRNCAQGLTRHSQPDRQGAPPGTPAEHMARFMGQHPDPNISNHAFLGACLGLRERDIGDLPGYVAAYFDANTMSDADFGYVLCMLLGLREGQCTNAPRALLQYRSSTKLRALVQAVTTTQVPYLARSALLGMASGTKDPTTTVQQLRSDLWLDWDMDQMRLVLEVMGDSPFLHVNVCMAVSNCFRNWVLRLVIPDASTIDDYVSVISERINMVGRLLGRLKFTPMGNPVLNPNRDARVHASCVEALSGLYVAVLLPFLNERGSIMEPRVANRLLDQIESLWNVIKQSGITLGARPSDALNNADDLQWLRMGVFETRLNQTIQKLSTRSSLNGQKMGLVRRLLRRMGLSSNH